ncbi:MAG: hypothetical protein HUK20_00205 [Fibrobacter sp.]|nr:hypothetical protein [Fibrobacter sp.]
MKKLIIAAALVGMAVSFEGCAMASTPLSGVVVTNVNYGVAATSNENSTKEGRASASSILGIIATGDASIAAAARNGGITKIHTVDVEAFSVLGIYATHTVIVRGE